MKRAPARLIVTAVFLRHAAKLIAAGAPLLYANAATAAEMAPPEVGSLDFAIIRGGETIGGDHADFRHLPDGRLEVRLKVEADVSLGPIALYHFRQQAAEVWRGERLVSMSSDTEENGERHHLTVAEDGDGLALTVDGKTRRIAADSVPMSLWSVEMAARGRPVFDGNDGQLYKTEVSCEPGAPHAGEGRGTACEITGELQRSLRYDAGGLLEDMSFSADDGSPIRYKRR